VRGVDAPSSGWLQADSKAGGSRDEGVDGVLRGPVWRARRAVLLLVPEMNPCLVADLHFGGDITEGVFRGLDHRVLGVPGEVLGVEVEQVIVLDAVGR